MKRTSQTKRKRSQSRSSLAGIAINYSMIRESYKIINIFAQHVVMIFIIRLIARFVCLKVVKRVF